MFRALFMPFLIDILKTLVDLIFTSALPHFQKCRIASCDTTFVIEKIELESKIPALYVR